MAARDTSQTAVATPAAPVSPTEDLLRQLLSYVAGDPVPTAADVDQELQEAQEVVLDLQVDGSRYTLIRCPPPAAPVALSPREREIARLIARGLPNKAIAAVLDISPWTVATYVRRLFAKLGVGSRAEMVARALADGLLGNGS